MSNRILYFVTEDWYFLSHRLSLARAAQDKGYEVIVITNVTNHGEQIKNEGFKLIPIMIKRSSKNIIKEILTFIQIVRIYRREKPDLVHHVAVKPVLYGSLAAKITGIKGVINAITGLGHIFTGRNLKTLILKQIVVSAYHFSFAGKNTIGIFQNTEDLGLFVDRKIAKKERVVLIQGSGVDINHFSYSPEPNGIPVILLASRMIWEKGIYEFVQAAILLKKNRVNCRMVLVGKPDTENPTSIPEVTLQDWQDNEIVEWWGQKDDMADIILHSNIAVLPTYREGLPKFLIEASSCGRPIVATDVPGCREIVQHKINGLLVPPHDVPSLASAIKYLIDNPGLRAKYGKQGREMVKSKFSNEIVVEKTLVIYKNLLEKFIS